MDNANDFAWEPPLETSSLFQDGEDENAVGFTNDGNTEMTKDAEDLEAEEDPLIFCDELERDIEHKGEDDEQEPSKSWSRRKTSFCLVLSALLILLLAAITVLMVDRRKARQRLQASGATEFQALSVDLQHELPVVTLQLSVLKSAFPKFTHVEPDKVECSFREQQWGKTIVAGIDELEDDEDHRQFLVNATIVPPAVCDDGSPEKDCARKGNNVVKWYAVVAWQALTRQMDHIGAYECHLHMDAKVLGILPVTSVERAWGDLYLDDLDSLRSDNIVGNGNENEDADVIPEIEGSISFQGEFTAPSLEGPDTSTQGQENFLGPTLIEPPILLAEQPDPDNSTQRQENVLGPTLIEQANTASSGNDDASVGNEGVETSVEIRDGTQLQDEDPIVSLDEELIIMDSGAGIDGEIISDDGSADITANIGNDTQHSTKPVALFLEENKGSSPSVHNQANTEDLNDTILPKSFVFVQDISADGVTLGIRLQLPKKLYDFIPRIDIQLPAFHLTMEQRTIEPSTHPALELFIERQDLVFSKDGNDQHTLAQIACVDADCPFYRPFWNILTDSLQLSDRQTEVVSLTFRAPDNDSAPSFLEQMVGKYHYLSINRVKLEHAWHSTTRRRRRLDEDVLRLDCLRVQNALFGDVFEMSFCMDIDLGGTAAMDASLNFYGYGGSMSGDVEWQSMEEAEDALPVLRLDGGATVKLQLDNTEDGNTGMDLAASAVLDLENLSIGMHVNNTADWWPFRLILEASTEYLDFEDMVVFRLDNGTFEVDSELYIHATGDLTVDNPNEKISMVINDPRLAMAVDGGYGDSDNILATWKMVYDNEDIMTGKSEMSLIDSGATIEATSDGKLTMDLMATGVYQEEQEYWWSDVDSLLQLDVTRAQLDWNGNKKADVLLSIVMDSIVNNRTSMEFFEKTNDHVIQFLMDSPDDNSIEGSSLLRLSGDDKMSSFFDIDIDSDGMSVKLEGEVSGRDYSIDIETEWNSGYPFVLQGIVQNASFDFDGDQLQLTGLYNITERNEQGLNDIRLIMNGFAGQESVQINAMGQWYLQRDSVELDDILPTTFEFGDAFTALSRQSVPPSVLWEYKGTSSLMVGGSVVWEESGHFIITDEDDTRLGVVLETLKDDTILQLFSKAGCTWSSDDEIFSCKLPELRFGIDETTYTDSSGSLTLDVPVGNIALALKDDFSADDRGYVLSMSGGYNDNVLSGSIEDFKVVWDGETKMDASMAMVLDFDQLVASYKFEDQISDTLMGLEQGKILMVWDDWDEELETMNVVMEKMDVMWLGEPYIKGGMDAGLDLVQQEFSLVMENNTTKLPMEFDFSVAVEDDQVIMDLNVLSVPAPTPVTPPPNDGTLPTARVTVNTTLLMYNTMGMTAKELNKNSTALAKAFEIFVRDLVMNLDGSQQNRKLSSGRRLEAILVDDSTTVYSAVDVICRDQSARSIPEDAKCQTVVGSYELVVVDENPAQVVEKYEEATDTALENGKLQEMLLVIDPEYPAFVLGSLDRPDAPTEDVQILEKVTLPPTEDSGSDSPTVVYALVLTTVTSCLVSCLVLTI